MMVKHREDVLFCLFTVSVTVVFVVVGDGGNCGRFGDGVDGDVCGRIHGACEDGEC